MERRKTYTSSENPLVFSVRLCCSVPLCYTVTSVTSSTSVISVISVLYTACASPPRMLERGW